MSPLFIIIGVGIVIGLVTVLIGFFGRPAGQDLVDDRVGVATERKEVRPKNEQRTLTSAVNRAIAGRGLFPNMSTQLARADLKITVGEYVMMCVLFAVIGVLLFVVIQRPYLSPIGILVGAFAPRIYVGSRQSARLKTFDSQLGDGLNLMVNSLRAGYSTLQAMEVISREMPTPISVEFGRVVKEMQLGVPFESAMLNLLRRIPSGDLDLVITAMSVQREVGGNLAEVLDAISFTIRERVRIKGEIKVMTAQGRITGYVITALPFGLGIFIYFVNPDYMNGMFRDPCGWIMLGISVVMIAIGYFVVDKIVSIEV